MTLTLAGKELEIDNPKIVREEPVLKINHKEASESLTPNGVVVIDTDSYEKMKKQLKVVQEKVLPLVYIDPECKKSPYRVYDNELYQHTETTKEEYDLLLDLKRGNENE